MLSVLYIAFALVIKVSTERLIFSRLQATELPRSVTYILRCHNNTFDPTVASLD